MAMGESSPVRRWVLLALVTLQQAGLTFVRFGLPALVPFIRPDLQLTLAQAGVVLGAFDLGALIAFYPCGLATERLGERRVMALGALVSGLVAAVASLAPGAGWLMLLLALAGVGFPSSQVAGSHAVIQSFPLAQRGVAMGIRQAGLPLGGLAAAVVLPSLSGSLGWRWALAVAGAACALIGVVTLVGLPDPPRSSPVAHAAGATGWRGLLGAPRRFAGQPALMLTTLTACLLAMGQFGLLGYLPLYMVDVFGWSQASAARLLVLVHVGGIAGRLVWGWISDRRFRGNRPAPLVVVSAGGALATALVAALGFQEAISPALAELVPAVVEFPGGANGHSLPAIGAGGRTRGVGAVGPPHGDTTGS